jgi:hypothetical protein
MSQEHWDGVYAGRGAQRVRWYQSDPRLSLRLLSEAAADIAVKDRAVFHFLTTPATAPPSSPRRTAARLPPPAATPSGTALRQGPPSPSAGPARACRH